MHSVAFFKEQIVCSAMQVISGGFIGVGASKFWGCKKLLSKFPQTCLKNFCAAKFPKNNDDPCFGVFCVTSRKSFFFCGTKVSFRRLSSASLIHNTNSNNVSKHLCQNFPGICPDVWEKLLWFLTNHSFVGVLCLNPRLLHHCFGWQQIMWYIT